MTEITLEELGLKNNPFESIIANEETAFQYNLYGREAEIERLSKFITESTNNTTQQRMMLMGEYGTGKTHHLLKLTDEINKGKYGDNFYAVYLGNLGISIRRLYESIIEKVKSQIPELIPIIDSLPDVEPEKSVEQTYVLEKLRDTVISNLNTLIAGSVNKGIKGIFLIIDEAEDIVQSDNPGDINYFVQCLTHLINNLNGTPLHIIMGFSREAMSRVTKLNGEITEEQRLGDAFIQRFPNKIYLGHLSEKDTESMIHERLEISRFTKNESFYPIKKEVIAVVNKLVSGHPREILSIMDQSLNETLYAGEREVDGLQVLRILSKHESFYSKSFILDWNATLLWQVNR
jgi:type II secretory pathway predicted ATPase ExeA